MPIDNMIAAGVQPSTPLHSPLQNMGGLMQLRGQMENIALHQAQIRESEQRQKLVEAQQVEKNREIADLNNFTELQKNGPLMRTFAETGDISELQRSGLSPKFIDTIARGRQDRINGLLTENHSKLQNRGLAVTQLVQTADNLRAPGADGKAPDLGTINARYHSALGALKGLMQDAGYDASKLPSDIASEDQLTSVLSGLNVDAGLYSSALARKKELGAADKAASDALTAQAEAAIKGKVNTGTSPLGVSEVQRMTESGDVAERAETKRFHDAELKNAAERIGVDRQRLFQDKEETHLTPEALAKMAEMFATTGTMPTLGQGKNAAAMRSQIINEAAKAFPAVQFATNQAAFQANKASLNSLQKNYDAVTAFGETAGKNLNTFLQTAGKIVDTGVPWLNKPLRALDMKLLGSSDQAAANAARTTALTEIAKVLNSANATGVLSDSARHEVEQLIGGDATMKQVVAAANILKQDMGNRKQSYQEQIKAINNRISGKQEESAPATSYKQTATGPNGHKIGSNDGGNTWYDLTTGAKI